MDTYVAWGEEDVAFGTAAGEDEVVRMESESLSYSKPILFSPSLGETTKRAPRSGLRGVSGDTVHVMEFEGFGPILKHALGACSTAALTNGYAHTFTHAAALFNSITVHVGKGGVKDIYTGCRVTQVEFKYEAGKPLMVTFTYVGVAGSTGAATASPVFPTAEEVVETMGAVTMGAQGAAADVAVDVKSAVVRYKAPFNENIYPCTDVVRAALPRSDKVEVSGELVMWWDDMTEYTLFTAATLCELNLTHTGSLIGGTDYYKFQIQVGAFKFTPTGDSNVGGADVLERALPFEGYVDDATDVDPYQPIELLLQNGVAAIAF